MPKTNLKRRGSGSNHRYGLQPNKRKTTPTVCVRVAAVRSLQI